MTDRLTEALSEIEAEYLASRERFGPFNSTHEGYAVILEELDELWETVRCKGFTAANRRDEARQVAAMALAFMLECSPRLSAAAKPTSDNGGTDRETSP